MTSPPDATDQLAALSEFHELLQRHDMAYWLFGGWAVDFHAGRVTRSHADLDVAIWWDDRSHLATLLRGAAWRHHPETDEDGYTVYTRGTVWLEVAFLARADRGVIYTPLREGRGTWPEDTFGDDVRWLLGVQARVIGLGALVADKSVVREDPTTAAKDHTDAASLALPVPHPQAPDGGPWPPRRDRLHRAG